MRNGDLDSGVLFQRFQLELKKTYAEDGVHVYVVSISGLARSIRRPRSVLGGRMAERSVGGLMEESAEAASMQQVLA